MDPDGNCLNPAAGFGEDVQLGVDTGSVLPPIRPFGRDVDHRQVPAFSAGCHLTGRPTWIWSLSVVAGEALDGVGRVD